MNLYNQNHQTKKTKTDAEAISNQQFRIETAARMFVKFFDLLWMKQENFITKFSNFQVLIPDTVILKGNQVQS